MNRIYIVETRPIGGTGKWYYDRASPTLKRAREVVRNQTEFWEREARITKFVPAIGVPRHRETRSHIKRQPRAGQRSKRSVTAPPEEQ